jgi:hypothetical protein
MPSKKKDVSVAIPAPTNEPPVINPLPVSNTAVENAKETDDELESKPVKPKKEPKKRGIKKGQASQKVLDNLALGRIKREEKRQLEREAKAERLALEKKESEEKILLKAKAIAKKKLKQQRVIELTMSDVSASESEPDLPAPKTRRVRLPPAIPEMPVFTFL